MDLYYSCISAAGQEQTRPDLSLGGFCSSTKVPNNSLSNVFSDLSILSIAQERESYIALFLKNGTGDDITDVIIYLEYLSQLSQRKVEVGFVIPNVLGEISTIPNPYSQPFDVEFYDIFGIDNSVNVGDLLDGGLLGIWFKETVNLVNIETEYSDDNLISNGTPVESDEVIDLIISWT